MIKTFVSKEAEKISNRQYPEKLPSDIRRVILRKLRMLNQARSISDLRVPSANCLERLSGNRKGQYSIRINQKWRVCFKWQENNAYDVEVVDYH